MLNVGTKPSLWPTFTLVKQSIWPLSSMMDSCATKVNAIPRTNYDTLGQKAKSKCANLFRLIIVAISYIIFIFQTNMDNRFNIEAPTTKVSLSSGRFCLCGKIIFIAFLNRVMIKSSFSIVWDSDKVQLLDRWEQYI